MEPQILDLRTRFNRYDMKALFPQEALDYERKKHNGKVADSLLDTIIKMGGDVRVQLEQQDTDRPESEELIWETRVKVSQTIYVRHIVYRNRPGPVTVRYYWMRDPMTRWEHFKAFIFGDKKDK